MTEKKFYPEHLERFSEISKKPIDLNARPSSEIILDDVDLRNLLKISRRTALEYRKKNVFPYYRVDIDSKVGKSTSKSKIYYILSEVIEGIKKNGGNHGTN